MTIPSVTRVILLCTIAAGGLVAGTVLSGARATAAGDVLHLVVETRSSNPADASRVAEYWLDGSRFRAKVAETTSEGTATTSTGPTWLLHVPPRGTALYFETPVGAGPTRSVFAALYYMRDAFTAGAAKPTAVTPDATVVTMGARTAAFEPASGLPLWERTGNTRIDYIYRLREHLLPAALAADFFQDAAGREIAYTIETTPENAASRVHFALYSAPALIGRPLKKTVLSYGANRWTLEQVGQVYGSDIQVSMSLLGQQPSEIRPGGEAVLTMLGPGRLYVEADGSVRLLVLKGLVATSVLAPDRQTAFSVAQVLQPVR